MSRLQTLIDHFSEMVDPKYINVSLQHDFFVLEIPTKNVPQKSIQVERNFHDFRLVKTYVSSKKVGFVFTSNFDCVFEFDKKEPTDESQEVLFNFLQSLESPCCFEVFLQKIKDYLVEFNDEYASSFEVKVRYSQEFPVNSLRVIISNYGTAVDLKDYCYFHFSVSKMRQTSAERLEINPELHFERF